MNHEIISPKSYQFKPTVDRRLKCGGLQMQTGAKSDRFSNRHHNTFNGGIVGEIKCELRRQTFFSTTGQAEELDHKLFKLSI